GKSEMALWIGSIGMPTDLGGLASFQLDLSSQPPPATQVTSYQDMKGVALTVGNGNDTITLGAPPPALVATTTVTTGSGQDHVVGDDYGGATTINLGGGPDSVDVRVIPARTGADRLTIKGGSGHDTIDIASTGDDAHTAFNGQNGQDRVIIESVGHGARTE